MTVRAECTLAAVPSSARAARDFIGDYLRESRAPQAVIADCQLAVSELASNVITHGEGSELFIAVDASDPQWWLVEVASSMVIGATNMLLPESWVVTGSDRISGRGLGIVRRLMTDIVVTIDAGRVSTRCRQRRTAH